MEREAQLIGAAGTLALLATLVGVLARGKHRRFVFFAVYVAAVLVHSTLVMLWPHRFHRNRYWQANEILSALLRLGMAFELAFRTFRAFPGALHTVRRVMLMILAGILIALLLAPADPVDYRDFVAELQPRVLNGTIWMLSAIAALILWYRLPVDPFGKAILLSYLPYLLVFTVMLAALGTMGWQKADWIQYANQIAYLALLCYWVYLSWRRDPPKVLREPPEEGP